MIDFSVRDLSDLGRGLGVAQRQLTGPMWDLMWTAFIRETTEPELASQPIIPREFTLVGMLEDAFRQGGVNAYNQDPWEDLAGEPHYAAYVFAREGGPHQMLVRQDAPVESRMITTLLKRDHGEHIEHVGQMGMVFGTRRVYAGRVQEGNFLSPYDEGVTPGPRPFLYITVEHGKWAAKGLHRILVWTIAAARAAGGGGGLPGQLLERTGPPGTTGPPAGGFVP